MSTDYLFKHEGFFARNRNLFIVIGGILIVSIAGFYIAKSLGWLPFLSKDESKDEAITVEPFSKSLILSLGAPLKDKAGIPYSGTVQYDPASETYSYIATADEGTITPIDTKSFSSSQYYLAVRTQESSSDLVVYDRQNYRIKRIVAPIDLGALVSWVAWSPTGTQFAYQIVGANTMSVIVENLEGETARTVLEPSFPIGFSPDGSKILTRVSPMLSIININDGTRSQTTGTAFLNPKDRFLLSPDSQSLISISEREIDWYRIDWESGVLTLLQKISSPAGIADAVFTSSSILVVRDNESKLLRLYEFTGESLKESFNTLELPENVQILHIIE